MTSIDDLDLPRSILNRVIKNSLPEGAQVQKEAKAAMTKACTVFINYLTAAALDVTKQNDRKSLNANDILKALTILEFDAFLPTVKGAVEGTRLESFLSKKTGKLSKFRQISNSG
ncbi:histone-fold-containing protein [Phlyctochytrium arcticum]|nr:histone-fold-containing protein [Phlyctochytrium arcticum]